MNILKPEQLTILTTSKCTARCGHCSVRSGPERAERLNYLQIKKVIDELHSSNPLRVVIFAGGEPTLLGEVLMNAISYADSLGINTRLVTNAYWAVTVEKARKKLISFREAGLQELNISADDYHLPYIPFERVKNAWQASKGLGYSAVVIANCWGPKSYVNPDFIMDQLEEELVMRFDDNGYQQSLGSPSKDGTIYALSNAQLQMLGRAHNEVKSNNIFYPQNQELLNGGCPWAVRSAALSPKNHLVACCGMEAEFNDVLDFGDASINYTADLVNKADNDVIINSIALMGPMYLKKFIHKHAPEVFFRERYGSVCELCEHIVSRPEAVFILNEFSGELAANILAIRSKLGDKV